jgi:predicted nicotinamide N-methyase
LAAELGCVADCRSRRVADLGCGRGALGLTALTLGAQDVLFADASPVAIDFVDRALLANRLSGRAVAVPHTWGGALPGAPYALLLGGDILYRPELFPALIATIAASLAPDGLCLLSDPRQRLEDGLPGLAARHGLDWRCERRPAGYTLVRVSPVVHRSDGPPWFTT